MFVIMSTRALVLTLLSIPAIAFAQEPPPPGAPAPVEPPNEAAPAPAPAPPAVTPVAAMPVAPVVEQGGPPNNGFQIQARLATQFGLTSILSPGFSMGYRMGNLVIGGQLGLFAGKLEDDTTTNSFSIVQLIPMVYWDFWQSRDGKARMNLVGGIGIGKASLKSEEGGMENEASAEFVPLLAGIGGDYYMHKNFALGVEISAQLPVLTKVEDNGADVGVKAATQSIHGMIRFTFIKGD
jgi:hypothetical protein